MFVSPFDQDGREVSVYTFNLSQLFNILRYIITIYVIFMILE